MAITVRCFSQVRERVGTDTLTLDSDGLHTLSDVVQRVATASADAAVLTDWLDAGHLRLAHNRTHAPADTPIADGDEVALFPPVSGG